MKAAPDAAPPVIQMQPAERPASARDGGGQTQVDGASQAGPGEGGPEPASPAEPPPREPSLSPAILAERGFGFAAPPGPLLPEDFLIGPLQDWRSEKETEQEALKAATAFLDGILAGRLPESLIAPGRLPLVSMLTREMLAGPRPVSYRIGAFQSADDEGEASMTARICLAYRAPDQAGADTRTLPETGALAGNDGEMRRMTGGIGLRRIKGIWYIESVNFADAPS
jgi:hypothetical protein